jgi:hypothetical protein
MVIWSKYALVRALGPALRLAAASTEYARGHSPSSAKCGASVTTSTAPAADCSSILP